MLEDDEFWRLPLTAGEQVVIRGTGYNIEVGIFPAGTTDKNLSKALAIRNAFPVEAPVRFTAHATGVYPLAFGPSCYDAVDEPFTFVVTAGRGAR